MKIILNKLHDGVNEWTDHLPPSELDLSKKEFNDDLIVEYIVAKNTGKVNIDMQIKTTANLTCDLCLEKFKSLLEGETNVVFIQRESMLPDEIPGDNVRSFKPGQKELDLSCDIRDALLLSLPFQLKCKSSCAGLCSTCGTNLNFESCHCKE